MDAVEFLVTRDRMCGSFNGCCTGCEVNERMGAGEACIHYMARHPQDVIEIVEQWGKEHLLKTRQERFLEMFPHADVFNGALNICPGDIDVRYTCHGPKDCGDCRKKYWLEEVEE